MPKLVIEQSAVLGMENSSPGITLKCKNAGILNASLIKRSSDMSCQSFNSVQGKQQSNACTWTIIQYNGFRNSWFPWVLTIFSAWAHYITFNMLYCCRIRIGNWFWNWTRSLFTQVNCCNSLIWCYRGLCEGVQERQSLKDPNNITFTKFYLKLPKHCSIKFYRKLPTHCSIANEQKEFYN